LFRKLAQKASHEERAELYSLTLFLLAALKKLIELSAIILLAFGLGQAIQDAIGRALPAIQPSWPSEDMSLILAVLAMAILAFLLPFPARLAISSLKSAFGLDTRPFRIRLGQEALRGLSPSLALALFSLFLLWLLREKSLAYWVLGFLACLWLPAALDYLWPFWASKARPGLLREPKEGELPPFAGPLAQRLKDMGGWKNGQVLKIFTGFRPGLSPPWPYGPYVAIPIRAAETLAPEAFKARLIIAFMARAIKLPRNLAIAKALVLVLAIPGAFILLNTFGLFWGYPGKVSVSLAPIFWLAAFLASQVQKAVLIFCTRVISERLAVATLIATENAEAFLSSQETLARYNLEPKRLPLWREIFKEQPSFELLISEIMKTCSELSEGKGGLGNQSKGKAKGF
jgi:hypothetical protein